MALVYGTVPSADAIWQQNGPTAGQHEVTIPVTGFVATEYYPMVAELYADPGLPQWNSTPDPVILNMRLRSWRIVSVQCGQPVPSIQLGLSYLQASFFSSSDPDSNGPSVFRSRSVEGEFETQYDRAGDIMEAIYSNEPQTIPIIIQRSSMLWEFERLETGDPEPRALPLLDTVNSVSWNGRAPRTALFSQFFCDTRDGGNTYNVFYGFRIDPSGIDKEYSYTGPDGLAPFDVKLQPLANIIPEVYPETDFSPLNLVK